MMAASLKDGEELVDLLLRKDADVNMTSNSYLTFLIQKVSVNEYLCRL
jgi:hypothetical protein